MAGAPGFEPGKRDLESRGLPLSLYPQDEISVPKNQPLEKELDLSAWGLDLLAGDLHLLMLRVLAAPRAELVVFNLAFYELPVLAGVVITSGADRAFQAD